jgi:hypothetical protein
MFIKDDNGLIFMKSINVYAFPCGRRRSTLIDIDSNPETVSDKYYLPFDPEARLNTEANNRKRSGLNGFKQNFISSWSTTGELSIVIAGYLFKLTTGYTGDTAVADFGNKLASVIADAESTKIFANIKLADLILMSANSTSGIPETVTQILRDQKAKDEPAASLDWPAVDADITKADSYYFYGLSFSSTEKTKDGFVSLQLLDKVNNSWVIHEASRLPKIDHGDTPGSVVIPGDLYVEDNVTANTYIINSEKNGNISMVGLKVAEDPDADTYQLQFFTK